MGENDFARKNMDLGHSHRNRESVWAIFCHLSAFLMFILPLIGNILGPLLIWSIKKNQIPRVDEEGKESLNFQISMTMYMLMAWVLRALAVGGLFMFGLVLTNIIFVVMASIKTSHDEQFRYPLAIRFIR
jgi:uncharacterized Tic20 family protein